MAWSESHDLALSHITVKLGKSKNGVIISTMILAIVQFQYKSLCQTKPDFLVVKIHHHLQSRPRSRRAASFTWLIQHSFHCVFKRLKWDFYSVHRIRTRLNYQWLQCCQCSWQSCICDLCLKMVTWVQCSFSVIQHLCSEEWGNFWFSVWGLTFPHVAGAL